MTVSEVFRRNYETEWPYCLLAVGHKTYSPVGLLINSLPLSQTIPKEANLP